jgi:hypothetical protein
MVPIISEGARLLKDHGSAHGAGRNSPGLSEDVA